MSFCLSPDDQYRIKEVVGTFRNDLQRLFVYCSFGIPCSELWLRCYDLCFSLCTSECDSHAYDVCCAIVKNSPTSLLLNYQSCKKNLPPALVSELCHWVWCCDRLGYGGMEKEIKLRIFLYAHNVTSEYCRREGALGVMSACQYLSRFWLTSDLHSGMAWGSQLLEQIGEKPQQQVQKKTEGEDNDDCADLTFISNDGHHYQCPVQLSVSSVISDFFLYHRSRNNSQCPLLVPCDHTVVDCIFSYLQQCSQPNHIIDTTRLFSHASQDQLLALTKGANFLAILDFLELCSLQVANMLKGKSAEEIMKFFNVEQNFTEEELEMVRRENLWLHE